MNPHLKNIWNSKSIRNRNPAETKFAKEAEKKRLARLRAIRGKPAVRTKKKNDSKLPLQDRPEWKDILEQSIDQSGKKSGKPRDIEPHKSDPIMPAAPKQLSSRSVMSGRSAVKAPPRHSPPKLPKQRALPSSPKKKAPVAVAPPPRRASKPKVPVLSRKPASSPIKTRPSPRGKAVNAARPPRQVAKSQSATVLSPTKKVRTPKRKMSSGRVQPKRNPGVIKRTAMLKKRGPKATSLKALKGERELAEAMLREIEMEAGRFDGGSLLMRHLHPTSGRSTGGEEKEEEEAKLGEEEDRPVVAEKSEEEIVSESESEEIVSVKEEEEEEVAPVEAGSPIAELERQRPVDVDGDSVEALLLRVQNEMSTLGLDRADRNLLSKSKDDVIREADRQIQHFLDSNPPGRGLEDSYGEESFDLATPMDHPTGHFEASYGEESFD